MLKEAIDRMVTLVEAAATPKIIDLPKEPSHMYGVVVNGKFQSVEANTPPRHHAVFSLEDVILWSNRLGLENDNLVVVWYNRTGVTALNDDDRRNQAKYKLTPSEPMLLLAAMQAGQQRTYKQADFVRLLRIKLAGCLGSTGNFLDLVRKVVFRTASESAGVVQHGKASLGKKIEAELQGAELVPEMVTLDVPVFENLDIPRESVECAVDIDAHNETFTLTPLPGEVEGAWRRAEASVRARLEGLVPEGWSGALCYGEP